jgi:hypothetical protein
MEREQFLSAQLDKWSPYHNHKEQMAFAATALYIGAAAG